MQKTAPHTACDYHKVGMSVKGRLVGTHRTHFHSHIWRSEVKGPFLKIAMPVFARVFWSVTEPLSRQAYIAWLVPMDSLGFLVSYDTSIFTIASLKLSLLQPLSLIK